MLDEDENNISPMDLLLARHRKEKKELKDKCLAMKKSAKCGNKQKQKETTIEIERLEREQLLRHEKEVVDLEAQLLPSLDNIFVNQNTVEEQKQDPSFYKEFTVKPKNKRKQARRSEATRRMQDAMNEDRVNASSSLRFTEMLEINKVLDERNLQLVDIPADGDCLYNAVTNQLRRIKGFEHVTGKDIRRRAAHYISDHKDEFVPFLTNDNGEPLNEFEFEQYCSKVENESREGGIWGGEPELNALSRSLERKIEQVIQPEGRVITFGEEFNTKPLIIVYHRHAYQLGEHYNSTELKPIV